MKTTLNSAAGETVTFVRDAATAEVTAIPTVPELAVEDDDGMVTQWDGLDWLVLAEDLTLDGLPVEPKRGDLLKRTQTDGIYVYETMAPPGLAHFAWVGPYRLQYRIHTKLVKVEDLT